VFGSPTRWVDPKGLIHAGAKSDPRKYTIVCDGKGGIVPQVNIAPPCVKDCIVVHELVHARDAYTLNPKVCKGAAAGASIHFPKRTRAESEIDANNAEIKCLKAKLKNDCGSCKQEIKNRIRAVEEYRNSFLPELTSGLF
jgi:hypothetical protein